jgi:guanylate kinase
MTPYIVTLTGPSCAGKSTLEARLRKVGFTNVISTTTRPPRAGEVDGQSYYFVSREDFVRGRDAGAFVENVEFNGELYGITSAEIRRVADLGRPIVMVVEPEGLRQVRRYGFDHGWAMLHVFVNNPPQVIASRFLNRMAADLSLALTGDKTASVIDAYSKRLAVIMSEEQHWEEQVGEDCHLLLRRFDESNIEDVAGVIQRYSYDFLRP